MAKREKLITQDLAVGISAEIDAALKMVSDFSGLRPSQYARQAIIHKLVSDGFMQHPMAGKLNNGVPAQGK